jgi:hypothetical protein
MAIGNESRGDEFARILEPLHRRCIAGGAPYIDRLTCTRAFIDWVREDDAESWDWSELRTYFDHLTEGFPIVVQLVAAAGTTISRACKLDPPRPIEAVADLGPPPAGLCSAFGRCNAAGEPALYCGSGTQLLLSEIGAKAGDRVAILHVNPKRQLRLLNIGAVDLFRRTGGHCLLDEAVKSQLAKIPLNSDGMCVQLLDAFVADYFTRPGSANTYKITSAYTAAMLEVPNLDGVMYDSVGHRGGKCMAMRSSLFPGQFEPVAVQMIQLRSDLGYGIFDIREVRRTSYFDQGQILWP